MPPKKRQKILFDSDDIVLAGLRKTHTGKRILLKATDIYKNSVVPRGEENYLFQYSVTTINGDCKTATIQFDERYIDDGGHKFINYPAIDDEDDTISNYSLKRIEDDHKEYNVHLGRGNKIINDEKAVKLEAEEAAKVQASDDISDLRIKFGETVTD